MIAILQYKCLGCPTSFLHMKNVFLISMVSTVIFEERSILLDLYIILPLEGWLFQRQTCISIDKLRDSKLFFSHCTHIFSSWRNLPNAILFCYFLLYMKLELLISFILLFAYPNYFAPICPPSSSNPAQGFRLFKFFALTIAPKLWALAKSSVTSPFSSLLW